MTKGICRNCGFNFEVDNWKADYYTCPNCGKIHSLEEMYFCVKRPAQDLFADQSVQLARFRVDNKKLEDEIKQVREDMNKAHEEILRLQREYVASRPVSVMPGAEKRELTTAVNNQQIELNQADAIIKRLRAERDSANHACYNLRASFKEAKNTIELMRRDYTSLRDSKDAALKRAAEYEHLTHVACEDARLAQVARDNANQSLSICRQERDQAVDKLADAERRADEAFWYSKYEAANKSIIAAEKRTTEAGRVIDHLRAQRSLLNQRLEELEEKGDDSFYDRKDEVMESFAEMLNTILVERDEKIKGLREETRKYYAGLIGAKHRLIAAKMATTTSSVFCDVNGALDAIKEAFDGEV